MICLSKEINKQKEKILTSSLILESIHQLTSKSHRQQNLFKNPKKYQPKLIHKKMPQKKEEVVAEMQDYRKTEITLLKNTERKKKTSIFIKLNYVLCMKKVSVKKEYNVTLPMDLNN